MKPDSAHDASLQRVRGKHIPVAFSLYMEKIAVQKVLQQCPSDDAQKYD